MICDKVQEEYGVAVPYKIPTWSVAPCHQFYLEVLKDGSIIDKFNVHEKAAYMFGRLDLCDFLLEHPTISRFHADVAHSWDYYFSS
ncbi:protein phosphatase 1 regulatory inhibitor subunit PPP1R8 protein [Trifolium repens]|nr:protein phosphatase 1 regulatory inhibitor subunit PPP1R8 protein [Trifolium repens]